MNISRKTYDTLVSITMQAKPNEACAYLFEENTTVVKLNPEEKSIGHFVNDSPALTSYLLDKFGNPSALFHSHPCAAIPSGTDKMYMAPTIAVYGCPWLIMSDNMKLRAWTITKQGAVEEIEVNII